MGPLRRRSEYDRLRILKDASLAAAKGRRRRAIAHYRRVLAVEPDNPDLLSRIAPLLADTGQAFDALESYRAAAEGHLREGRPERAVAVYREAAKKLPREAQIWTRLAHLQQHGRAERAAVQTLLEGRKRFRGRRRRPQAIHLLRRILSIDPGHVEATLDLVWLLAAQRRRDEALRLLDELAERVDPSRLRRVRATRLRIDPSLASLWRWLRAPSARGAGAGGPHFLSQARPRSH